MSTIRIEKNKNYTTMSNFHLKDMNLSLRAKGLLSFMLSLPEDWDYSVRGLAKILPESEGTIKTILKELENRGYLVRDQKIDPSGKFGKAEYTVFEKSQINQEVEPWDKNPTAVKPTAESYPTNIYTNKQITKKQKTKEEKKKECNEYRNGFLSENSLSEKNTKDLDTSIISRQVIKVCRENGVSDDKAHACFSVIKYYVDQHKKKFGRDHKVITNKAMAGIITRLLNGVDDVLDPIDAYVSGDEPIEDYKIQVERYKLMIDQHFKTEYNGKVDYNISHFMSEGIIRNRFYETC